MRALVHARRKTVGVARYFLGDGPVELGDGATTTGPVRRNSMYTIAVLALMGLALFKLVDVIEDLLPGLTRFHSLVTIALGIAGAVGFDYSMTSGLKTEFRHAWMGTWATGLVIAGATSLWRGLFHWLRFPRRGAPRG